MTILARLQAATGPDREIDAAIAVHLGWTKIGNGYGWKSPDDDKYHAEYPAFTGSLDLAETLAGDREYMIHRSIVMARASMSGSMESWWSGVTPALALCIAWAAEGGW